MGAVEGGRGGGGGDGMVMEGSRTKNCAMVCFMLCCCLG